MNIPRKNIIIVVLIILASALLSLVACDKPQPVTPKGTYTIEVMQYYDYDLEYELTIDDVKSHHSDYIQLIYPVDSIPNIILHSKTDLVIRKYYDITKSKKILIKANKQIILN